MILKVRDIFRASLSLIGVVERDETMDTSDLNLMLIIANTMLARWSANRLIMRSTKTISFTMVPNKETYTIALTGADITSEKPLNVVSCYVRDDGTHDYTVTPQSIDFYNALPNKITTVSIPEYIIFEPGLSQQAVQTGTFIFYPSPNRSFTANVEVDVYLTEFGSIDDVITFEPIYYEPLIYNLAVRAYRHFRTGAGPIPEDIAAFASTSLRSLKTINHSLPTAKLDVPSRVGGYNIYTDR